MLSFVIGVRSQRKIHDKLTDDKQLGAFREPVQDVSCETTQEPSMRAIAREGGQSNPSRWSAVA